MTRKDLLEKIEVFRRSLGYYSDRYMNGIDAFDDDALIISYANHCYIYDRVLVGFDQGSVLDRRVYNNGMIVGTEFIVELVRAEFTKRGSN